MILLRQFVAMFVSPQNVLGCGCVADTISTRVTLVSGCTDVTKAIRSKQWEKVSDKKLTYK
jgi:hypothetical protein